MEKGQIGVQKWVGVRNSLSTRSFLDGGVMTWVLKVEEGGGYDKSDDKGDDNGLYRQRCKVLSIPWTLRDVGTLLKYINDLNNSGNHCFLVAG